MGGHGRIARDVQLALGLAATLLVSGVVEAFVTPTGSLLPQGARNLSETPPWLLLPAQRPMAMS